MNEVRGAVERHPNDYDVYPEWFPIRISEVEFLTGINRGTIAKRLKEGAFPEPTIDETNGRQVWALGDIRQFCKQLTGGV